MIFYMRQSENTIICVHICIFFSFRKIAKLRMIFPKVFVCRTEYLKVPSRLSRVYLCLI